jgi:hypothetical protein
MSEPSAEDELLAALERVARIEEEERGLPPHSLDEPFRQLLGYMKGLPNAPDSASGPSGQAGRRRRSR